MTITYTGNHPHIDRQPYKRLAASVLERAVYEGERGAVDALLWLASPDAALFCDMAELHPDKARRWALEKLTDPDPRRKPKFSAVWIQEVQHDRYADS